MSFYPVAPLPDTNSRQVATTIRPPSTSLLTIDSEDRFASPAQASAAALLSPDVLNATPYNFAIRKNESLMNGFFTRVGISEINFPWGIPNINAKTSQIIVNWTDANTDTSGSQVIQLDYGFYTPEEIAAVVEAEIQDLNDAGGVLMDVSMNYGSTNDPQFDYLTNDSNILISFSPMPYNSVNYPYPATTRQLFHLMGFTDYNSILAPIGFSGYTFCQFTRYIDICCFQLTNNQALKDQTSQTVARDMLCRLYLGNANDVGSTATSSPDFCPPGCAPFTIYRNYTVPKQIQWLPNQPIPGYLQFEIFDDAGAPLTEILQNPTGFSTSPRANYLDWSMTMMVSEN